MPFLGCIENLSLPEVLQTISLGKRTGSLTILGPKGTGRITLHRGRVLFASSEGRERLGSVLVQRGLLTLRELKQVLLEQKRSLERKPLGTLLLERGLIEKKLLEQEIRQHLLKAFKEITKWEDGVFYFHKDAVPQGPILVEEGLNTDFLLLESSRLWDEEAGAGEKEKQDDEHFELDEAT